MELIWEYSLPTNERSTEYVFESPILQYGQSVFYVTQSSGDWLLHIIDIESGVGSTQLLDKSCGIMPSECHFFTYNDKVYLYTGDLWVLQNGVILKHLDLSSIGGVNSHLLIEDHWIISCSNGRTSTLCSIELDTLTVVWQIDISNTKPYRTGELTRFGDWISCYGKDQLLFVEPARGEIVSAIRIPRIDKLFSPISLDDDTMLIGYTNWTNAGILKYSISAKRVLWRHKRKFEGPQLRCAIYRLNDHAFWVKNDTELICLNIETGDEIFKLRTTPWLYTKLQPFKDGFLYGTAGADGYLNYVSSTSGHSGWSVFLKNGCAYYDTSGDHAFVGDYDNTIKQISLHDGSIIQEYHLDAEVVGRITVSSNCLYTVIWGNAEKNVRLVKIRLP